jgi:hypothetical protein
MLALKAASVSGLSDGHSQSRLRVTFSSVSVTSCGLAKRSSALTRALPSRARAWPRPTERRASSDDDSVRPSVRAATAATDVAARTLMVKRSDGMERRRLVAGAWRPYMG